MTNSPAFSAIGSMPGTDVRETVRVVRDLFDGNGIPFLPELPARGPGADMIGRSAARLAGLGVDLQPSGWRLTDASGLDARRAQAFLREDLDELAEAFDGYEGPLKVQWSGPWTLAASVSLPRGERVLTDRGATRDLRESLSEGVRSALATVRRLVPGAQLILQWDEPSLPAVLAGALPTASGYGRVRPVEQSVVVDGLSTLVASIEDAAAQVLHCCAPGVPVPLLRRVHGLDLAVDTSLVKPRQWDGVAELVESGRRLWAGAVPADGSVTRPEQISDPLVRTWRSVGLTGADLRTTVLTPACGLAGSSPEAVRALFKVLAQAAERLGEESENLSGS